MRAAGQAGAEQQRELVPLLAGQRRRGRDQIRDPRGQAAGRARNGGTGRGAGRGRAGRCRADGTAGGGGRAGDRRDGRSAGGDGRADGMLVWLGAARPGGLVPGWRVGAWGWASL